MNIQVIAGSVSVFWEWGGAGLVVGRCKRGCLYLSVVGTCES